MIWHILKEKQTGFKVCFCNSPNEAPGQAGLLQMAEGILKSVLYRC